VKNNYLARLGWSHGDEEVFTMDQFCAWFDLDNLTKSPAQFNPEKLAWLNNHYIKLADNSRLAALAMPELERDGAQLAGGPKLSDVIAVLKDRANTVNELADAAMMFYRQPKPDPALLAQHLTDPARAALKQFVDTASTIEWSKEAIAGLIKQVLADHQMKMPLLAMPLRLLVTGQLQTPAVDVVLALFGRNVVLDRINQYVL
jgi:glutamyl-tRNA synthetase